MEEKRGRVEVPAEYFLKMAKNDYTNWKRALAREFYQNSIDARASVIEVTADVSRRRIKVVDDGIGMDERVLLNKLLVLGGSEKAAGSVGAFGKAKELLFFSWKSYKIRTQNWLVTGRGADFKLQRLDAYVKGTEVEIEIQDEESINELMSSFRDVACLMQTKTRIMVGGSRMQCCMYCGTKVLEEPWCAVYQTKCRDSHIARVRIGGVWMFDWWIGRGAGEIVIELTKSSVACLTSNRDHLKGEYRAPIEALLRRIMIDKKSALESKTKDVLEQIQGTGRIRVDEQQMQEAEETKKSGDWKQLGDRVKKLSQLAEEVAVGRVQDLMSENYTVHEFRNRLKLIGYKPDFCVLHSSEFGKVSRVMKQQQSGLLGRMWTEVVKQVLLDNSTYIEFTAGFTFKDQQDASMVKSNGQVSFLLNPLHLGVKSGIYQKLFSNRAILMEELKALAVHEVTHLQYTEHDEEFSSAMETVRAKTWKSAALYHQLSKMK